MQDQEKLMLLTLLSQYEHMIENSSNSADNVSLEQELSMIKRVYNEVEWYDMTDEMKQKKRKAMIIMMDKWAHEEGEYLVLTYEKSVVELYDKIDELMNTNYFVDINDRIKALLFVEKVLINDKKEFSLLRHVDYYMWGKVFDGFESEDENKKNIIQSINDLFKLMYSKWPKRPYKEI